MPTVSRVVAEVRPPLRELVGIGSVNHSSAADELDLGIGKLDEVRLHEGEHVLGRLELGEFLDSLEERSSSFIVVLLGRSFITAYIIQ